MEAVKIEQPAAVYDPLKRILPQPPVSEGFAFAKQFAQNMLGTAADTLNGITGGIAGVNGDYASLIQQQIEVQKQMMLTSMISNVEKSKHETQMAPVRNIRVG